MRCTDLLIPALCRRVGRSGSTRAAGSLLALARAPATASQRLYSLASGVRGGLCARAVLHQRFRAPVASRADTACTALRFQRALAATTATGGRPGRGKAEAVTGSRAARRGDAGTNPDLASSPPVEFEFDPMSSVQHDAAVETAKRDFEGVLESLLPDGAPPAAVEKVRHYLEQHPVDTLITAADVQITHLENPESGEEERASLSPVPLAEALEQAQLRKMNLVQMGSRDTLAFCRIRHEKPWVYKLIAAEMKAVEEAQQQQQEQQEQEQHGGAGARGGGHLRGGRGSGGLRPMADHTFRDAVDAHFIGWKSKKICDDLRKGHPVKLTIRDFQSPESAVHKLRELSLAMKTYAEEKQIWHHFTSIVANDREASISFSPAVVNKAGQISKLVKHPGEKEWSHALRRMQDACQKVGRAGTYMKSGRLKPRNTGATTFRVDKYGRRVD